MKQVSKKWPLDSMGMRAMLALLYLFALLCVPLGHTCQPADNDVHSHQLDCDDHQLHCNEHAGIRPIATFNQNDIAETNKSYDQHCSTCLHSLTWKNFKLCSITSLCSTQTVVRTQVLPQLSFIVQPEWFCSAPLRGPPCITS